MAAILLALISALHSSLSDAIHRSLDAGRDQAPVTVLRHGAPVSIASQHVCVGDVVVLLPGARLVAGAPSAPLPHV